jgi:hypothetical protein
MSRSKLAVVLALCAWAVLGVMVVAPWFEDREEFWFSPELYYAVPLTPVVFALALGSFWLAEGSDRAALLATRVSMLVAAALLLYWTVPWAWNIFTDDY